MSTIIITGASRGIGRALAHRYAAPGVNLAICCLHREEDLRETEKLLQEKGAFVYAALGDVGDYAFAEAFAGEAQRLFGPPDLLINNAGISWVGLFSEMRPEDWDKVIRTNLTSVYNMTSQVLPDMIHKKAGQILNICFQAVPLIKKVVTVKGPPRTVTLRYYINVDGTMERECLNLPRNAETVQIRSCIRDFTIEFEGLDEYFKTGKKTDQ